MHSAIFNPTLLFSHISCINETYTVNYLSEKIVNSEFKGSYTKFTTFKVILKKICTYIRFNVFSYKTAIHYESITINMLTHTEK